MKVLLLSCMLLPLAACGLSAVPAQPQQRQDGTTRPLTSAFQPRLIGVFGSICFERPEEMGRSNIEPLTVIVGNLSELTLIGGYAGCVYLPPGRYPVSLQYPVELGGATAPSRYATKIAVPEVAVTPGGVAAFEICGAYTSWDVVPAGTIPSGGFEPCPAR